MRAFIEMLLRDVSFMWNVFGDNHTARINENMFPIGAETLDEAFISALIEHAKGQGFELYSREDLEAAFYAGAEGYTFLDEYEHKYMTFEAYLETKEAI